MKIKSILKIAKNKAVKFSPEIFVGAGCVGLVAAGVIACRKTLKINEIKEKNKDILEQIDTMEENGLADENVEYTSEDAKNDRRIVKIKTGLDYVKLYSLPVGLGILSIGSIIWGHKILRKRNAALIAAYTAVDKSFKEYRKRVVDRFGEEVDKQLRFNTKSVEEKEKVKGEDGKTKTVKTSRDVVDNPLKGYSDYARMYDDGCNGWSKDPEDSLFFLKRQEMYLNNKLRSCKGNHIFLNEVYDILGFQRTKAGQIVGWYYDPTDSTRDNYISFGIYDVSKPKNGDFINGYERAIILDFNVDGPIVDLI